jgi:peptidoglycan/LPS O-acetylase OafA/YrhL
MPNCRPQTADREAQAKEAPKLIGLEVLRFLAALAVLVWHYQHFWFVGDAPAAGFVRADQPLYGAFRLFYEAGVYGVQVFWGISGYIFFWKYRRAISQERLGAWEFFVLRLSRLYPLHLLTFVLVALLQALYFAQHNHYFVYLPNDLHHAALQLFMASNWGFEAGQSFNGPIWSVSLEVLAYLLFFTVLRFLGASPWISAALVAAAALAYVLKIQHALLQCIVCFFLGGLSATAASSAFAQHHRRLLGPATAALLCSMTLLFTALQLFERKVFLHLYIVAGTPLLLYWLAEHSLFPDGFTPWIEAAGNITYASYLIHFPLQLGAVLLFHSSGWSLPKQEAWFFLSFLMLTLALSVGVYRSIEMPCQAWVRKRLLAPKSPGPAAFNSSRGRRSL